VTWDYLLRAARIIEVNWDGEILWGVDARRAFRGVRHGEAARDHLSRLQEPALRFPEHRFPPGPTAGTTRATSAFIPRTSSAMTGHHRLHISKRTGKIV
jgi:hypothetical protein